MVNHGKGGPIRLSESNFPFPGQLIQRRECVSDEQNDSEDLSVFSTANVLWLSNERVEKYFTSLRMKIFYRLWGAPISVSTRSCERIPVKITYTYKIFRSERCRV